MMIRKHLNSPNQNDKQIFEKKIVKFLLKLTFFSFC